MTRTPQPTADILDIAAVVTGEQRMNLDGWQYTDAIAAMTALGHSTRHIAYSLNRTEAAIRTRALRNGITVNSCDQRLDWFAIDMVASGGARMRLLGLDRLEAIRMMAARGLNSIEMARRLNSDPHNIRTLAASIGIRMPRETDTGWHQIARPNAARRVRREAVAA